MALAPDDRAGWDEAGKVAAWSGLYADAFGFYQGGLAVFPDDPSLTVNYALAKLWGGAVNEAEALFRRVDGLALADPAIEKWLLGQAPKRVVLARRKLINIVI